MKSLQELINDADDIQKRLAQHKVDLYEYAESLNENHVVDIDKLMMKASHCKIEHHILQDINDDYVIGSYLQLLLSVAQVNITDDKGENHPALYACRIAAVLPKIPDMRMQLQSSMILDEKGISDCVDNLMQHELVDIFIFDALMMVCLYDKGNEEKLEYIAELATFAGIITKRMNEILMFVETVTSEKKELRYNFNFINIEPFLKIVLGKMDVIINSDRYEIISYLKPTLYERSGLTKKKDIVLFQNLTFNMPKKSDSRKNMMCFESCNKVQICDCFWKGQEVRLNFYDPILTFTGCREVILKKAEFCNLNIIGDYRHNYRNSLIIVDNNSNALIESCTFNNIQSFGSEGEPNNYGIIIDGKNSRVTFLNLFFHDCYELMDVAHFSVRMDIRKLFSRKLVYIENGEVFNNGNCKLENSCELL